MGWSKKLFGAALCALAVSALGVTAAVSNLVGVKPAGAEPAGDGYAAYFPLDAGRVRSFQNPATGERTNLAVRDSFEGSALVEGIPGLRDPLLRGAGDDVLAWDAAQARWEPLFRFAEAAGTTYGVSLASERWSEVAVTVLEREAGIALPGQGVQLADGIRLGLAFADGGAGLPSEIDFARGKGMVKLVQNGAPGALELDLAQAALADEQPRSGSAFELTLRLIPERDGQFTLEAVTLTPDACHVAGAVREGSPGGTRGLVSMQSFIFEIDVREGRCAQQITPVRQRVRNLVLGPEAGRIGVTGFAVVNGRTVATASAQLPIPTTRGR